MSQLLWFALGGNAGYVFALLVKKSARRKRAPRRNPYNWWTWMP